MGSSKVMVGCEWQRWRLRPPLATIALEGRWWIDREMGFAKFFMVVGGF